MFYVMSSNVIKTKQNNSKTSPLRTANFEYVTLNVKIKKIKVQEMLRKVALGGLGKGMVV